jgi:hypothetical protein
MTTSGKTLAQSLAAIEALDLEPIKFKAMRSGDGYGWSQEHADRTAVAYKRYLILLAKYPEMTLAPDQDTDRFWHTHILDTMKYAADCDAIFGRFIHHFPYLGLRGEEDARALDTAFAAMQKLLAEEFGEGAEQAAAWCAQPPTGAEAAWCAQPPTGMKAAWCAQPPTGMKAAWCAQPPTGMKAAWCAQPPVGERSDERLVA